MYIDTLMRRLVLTRTRISGPCGEDNFVRSQVVRAPNFNLACVGRVDYTGLPSTSPPHKGHKAGASPLSFNPQNERSLEDYPDSNCFRDTKRYSPGRWAYRMLTNCSRPRTRFKSSSLRFSQPLHRLNFPGSPFQSDICDMLCVAKRDGRHRSELVRVPATQHAECWYVTHRSS